MSTYRLVGLTAPQKATLRLLDTDRDIFWADMPDDLWKKWWPFFKESEENHWKRKWKANVEDGKVLSIEEWDGWIDAESVLPSWEGYFDVKFEDGTEDEKPFRNRPNLNIKGFMTTNKVTHWRDIGKQIVK